MFIKAFVHITLLRKQNHKHMCDKGKLWWVGQDNLQLLHQNQMTTKSDKLVRGSRVIGRAMKWYCSLGSIMAGEGIWCPGLLRRRATRAGWYIRARSKWLFTLPPPPHPFVYQKGMHLSQSFFQSHFFVTEGGEGGDITCWCSLMTTSEGCSGARWFIRLDDTWAVEDDTRG